MTVTATQADATAPPVAVAVAGLPQTDMDGLVTGIVQRSVDGVRWTTVRGRAEAAQRLEADRGLSLPAADFTSYASTSGDPALSGDLRIAVSATLAAWDLPGVTQVMFVEQGSTADDTLAYALQLLDDATISLGWSADGSTTLHSVSPSVADWTGQQVFAVTLDVDDGGSHTVQWWTANTIDQPDWVEWGDPDTQASTTSVFDSAADVQVGRTLASDPGQWMVHAVQVSSASGLAVDVRFGNAVTGDTSFVDRTGLTWTLNGDAAIVGLGDLDSVDDYEFRPGVVNTYRAGVNQLVATFSEDQAAGLPDLDTGQGWTAVEPTPALVLPGTSGAYASTPDAAALDTTGDLDLRIRVAAAAWDNDSEQILYEKYDATSNQRSYSLRLNASGGLVYRSSSAGTAATVTANSTLAVPVGNGQDVSLRVTHDVNNGASQNVVTFYYSSDTDLSTAVWTMLGTAVTTAGATSIFAGSAPTYIGEQTAGGLLLTGIVYAAQLRSSIAGTVVANPDFTAQTPGTTSFVDSTGLTWTVNGDARIGYDAHTSAGRATIAPQPGATSVAFLVDDPTDVGDVEQSVTISTNAGGAITGDNVVLELRARWIGDDDYYSVRAFLRSDGSIRFDGVARNHDFLTLSLFAVTTALTYTGTETYRLRMRVTGHLVQAKMWEPAAEPEPDWMAEGTVSADRHIAGGQIGISANRLPANTNTGFAFLLDDYVADIGEPQWVGGTDTITPGLTDPWLCSPMRSFLNRAITVASYEEPRRTGRGGAVPVHARTLPVGLNELTSSRTWTLRLRTSTLDDARALEYLIASGDTLWLLVPHGSPIPGGYYRAGQLNPDHNRAQGPTRWHEIPLTEVAAPGPDILTAQATWDTVIALYGTWADVVAAQPTWEDLLDLVGDPAEVIAD